MTSAHDDIKTIKNELKFIKHNQMSLLFNNDIVKPKKTKRMYVTMSKCDVVRERKKAK